MERDNDSYKESGKHTLRIRGYWSNMSKTKRGILIASMIIFFVFLISSCAANKRFGMISTTKPFGEEDQAFEEFRKMSFEDYNIYWCGVSKETAIAYLVDPKNDDKEITMHPLWVRVTDKKELQKLRRVGNVKGRPGIYSVLGADKETYGYIYTYWEYAFNNLQIITVDEKTIYLGYLPPPGVGRL